jgi:sulfatase maturation enzyme AslB (radical SAM superfamily)
MHTVMDWRGDLWLCCYGYVHGEDHRLGNIFEQNFDDLWFSQSHQQKVAGIKREKCAEVDCKFFRHHHQIEDAVKRGAGYWL